MDTFYQILGIFFVMFLIALAPPYIKIILGVALGVCVLCWLGEVLAGTKKPAA